MIKSDIAGDVRGKIGYVLNIFIDTAMRNIYPRSPLSAELPKELHRKREIPCLVFVQLI